LIPLHGITGCGAPSIKSLQLLKGSHRTVELTRPRGSANSD
jgi:hypothetical protein